MVALATGFPKVVRGNPAVKVRVYVSGTTRGVQVRLRAKRHGDAVHLEWHGPLARDFAQELLAACDEHDRLHAAECADAVACGLSAIDTHSESPWQATEALAANCVAEGCRWLSRRVGPWNPAEQYFQGVLAVEAACRVLSRDPDDASIFSLDDSRAAEDDAVPLHQKMVEWPAPELPAEDSLDVFTL